MAKKGKRPQPPDRRPPTPSSMRTGVGTRNAFSKNGRPQNAGGRGGKTSGSPFGAGKRVPGANSAGPGDDVNLFERLWNRKKFDVLGKKVKGEQKKLGKARGDAIERRKATLLQEYQQRGKANAFLDRRFGESDEGLSQEEKAIMRFQKERQAQMNRKSKFSLGDNDGGEDGAALGEEEEVLTHGGAALSHLDDFTDDVQLDDEDDDRDRALNAEMVRRMNFGGGFVPKFRTPGDGDDDAGDDDRPKTKKEVMDEIISKSKFFKAQKAKEKEEDHDLLAQLDTDFRHLAESQAIARLARPKKGDVLLGKKGGKAEAEKGEVDDYERMAKEMVFDLRAHAGDRVKTPEENAAAERKRLEALEKKRKKRMLGEDDTDDEDGEEEDEGDDEEGGGGKGKRRAGSSVSSSRREKKQRRSEISGDDLGENFALDGEDDDEDEDGAGLKKGWVHDVMARRDDDGDDDDDEEEEDEEDGERGEDEDDEEDGESGEEGEEEEGGEGGEEDKKKALLRKRLQQLVGADVDWEQSDEEDDKAEEEEEEGEEWNAAERRGRKAAKGTSGREPAGLQKEKAKEDQMSTKAGGPVAKATAVSDEEEDGGLPFVIDAPQTLDAFRRLVDGRSTDEMVTAVQRIRACNAISLAAENRRKMQIFYGVLLQYFAALAGEAPLDMRRIDALTRPLVELSGATPLFAAHAARERITRMHKHLSARLKAPDGGSCWASVRVLLLLRLWGLIFPSSDFRHPVMTPAMLLVGEYLTRCPVWSIQDVTAGLFLSSLALNMVSSSRRFFPEAINFVHVLLRTALLPAIPSPGPEAGAGAVAGGPDAHKKLKKQKIKKQTPEKDEGRQGGGHGHAATAGEDYSSGERLKGEQPGGATGGSSTEGAEDVPAHLRQQVCSHPWLALQGPPTAAGDLPPGTAVSEGLDFVAVMTGPASANQVASGAVRAGLIGVCLNLIKGFAAVYSTLPSFPEIFAPLLSTLGQLERQGHLPENLGQLLLEAEEMIRAEKEAGERIRQPVRMRAKRAVPIKQFNPRFEDNFALGRDYDPDKERAERKKLQKQIKRESRGAARELRKDNYFLAEERERERVVADDERSDKYRAAMAFLEGQEAAYKSGQMGKGKRKGKR
eukprot:jgi/Mesen1/5682/ME000288S04895